MARVTIFSYQKGNSLLHRLDPRFKFFYMVLLSMTTLSSGFLALAAATVLICSLLLQAGIQLLSVPQELKIFPYFLLFVFISRMLTTPGESIFTFYFLTPTWEGMLLGLHFCWRLSLIILVSLAFIISTTTNQIKAAVEFYFARVPGIPEKRVSMMLSLLIRFIPIIFRQVQETIDAQNARCVELRKNPLYRLVRLTIPILHRIFSSGDKLAIAMASRCYTEERTPLELNASRYDWYSLPLLLCLIIFMKLL